MTTGEVVALVGGAAGGALITGVFAIYRDQRAAGRVNTAAMRVLEGELKDAIELSCAILKQCEWPIAVRPLWNESWGTYRTAVASTVTPEEFAQLEAAYRHLNQLEHALKDSSKWGQRLSEPEGDQIGADQTFLLRGTSSCEDIDQEQRLLAVRGDPKNVTTGPLDRALMVFES